MNSKKIVGFMSLLGLLLSVQTALAASVAVQEMAGVLVHLEHFPSDAEKTKLKGIVDNKSSTEQERVLATAISNLKHKATAEDKDKLKHLMDDTTTPAEVRELAGVVLNISHMPSAEDKGKLEKLMK